MSKDETKQSMLALLDLVEDDELTNDETDNLYIIFRMFKKDSVFKNWMQANLITYTKMVVSGKRREFITDFIALISKHGLE